MSRIEKLLERILSKPNDFTWKEMKKVLKHFDYSEKSGNGSRRKFINEEGKIITLHEPHPKKILKKYMIELIIEHLKLEEDG